MRMHEYIVERRKRVLTMKIYVMMRVLDELLLQCMMIKIKAMTLCNADFKRGVCARVVLAAVT